MNVCEGGTGVAGEIQIINIHITVRILIRFLRATGGCANKTTIAEDGIQRDVLETKQHMGHMTGAAAD